MSSALGPAPPSQSSPATHSQSLYAESTTAVSPAPATPPTHHSSSPLPGRQDPSDAQPPPHEMPQPNQNGATPLASPNPSTPTKPMLQSPGPPPGINGSPTSSAYGTPHSASQSGTASSPMNPSLPPQAGAESPCQLPLPSTPTLHSPSKPLSSPYSTSYGSPGTPYSSTWTPEKQRGKKRGGREPTKGLSLFSRLVCDKVEAKRKTTYVEVSDELVNEFKQQQHSTDGTREVDDKNIRRRVYDALNVLIALDIVRKDRKDIYWGGLPGKNVDQMENLQSRRDQLEMSVKRKRAQLTSLVASEMALRSLMLMNEADASRMQNDCKVKVPFIVLNTDERTKIYCEMRADKEKIFFKFNETFEIHEDVEVLRHLNLGQPHDLKEVIDERLVPYVPPRPPMDPSMDPSLGVGGAHVSIIPDNQPSPLGQQAVATPNLRPLHSHPNPAAPPPPRHPLATGPQATAAPTPPPPYAQQHLL